MLYVYICIYVILLEILCLNLILENYNQKLETETEIHDQPGKTYNTIK